MQCKSKESTELAREEKEYEEKDEEEKDEEEKEYEEKEYEEKDDGEKDDGEKDDGEKDCDEECDYMEPALTIEQTSARKRNALYVEKTTRIQLMTPDEMSAEWFHKQKVIFSIVANMASFRGSELEWCSRLCMDYQQDVLLLDQLFTAARGVSLSGKIPVSM